MTRTARFISFIFHPLLMPFIGFCIIFNSGTFEINIPPETIKFTYLLVILFSIILPISIIPFLIYWRLAQNIEFNIRRERFIPTLFTALSLLILFIFLNQKMPITLIKAFSLSVACSAIVLLLLNFFLKISMHLIALGGITGLMAILTIDYHADLLLWLPILLVVTGLVSSARLYLHAHKLFEIVTGYIIGFLVTYGIIYFASN